MLDEKDDGMRALSDDELGAVSGGYAGKDQYDWNTYKNYGIAWEHNIWSKDKYVDTRTGQFVSQSEAERLVASRMAEEIEQQKRREEERKRRQEERANKHFPFFW